MEEIKKYKAVVKFKNKTEGTLTILASNMKEAVNLTCDTFKRDFIDFGVEDIDIYEEGAVK